MQYDLCDSVVYSREMINMFFVGQVPVLVENFKHLSPDSAIFPWCNAAMGGARLIIAKHVTCHVNKPQLPERKHAFTTY